MKFRVPKLRLSESNDACINCRAGAVSQPFGCKCTKNISKKRIGERKLTLFPHKYFAFCQEKRYIKDGSEHP